MSSGDDMTLHIKDIWSELVIEPPRQCSCANLGWRAADSVGRFVVVGCRAHVEMGTSKVVLVCLLSGSTMIDMWKASRNEVSQMKLNMVGNLGLKLRCASLSSPLCNDR